MKNTNERGALPAIVAAIAVMAAWILFNGSALRSLHLRWLQLDEAYVIGYPAALLALWWGVRHREVIVRRNRGPSVVALLLLFGALLGGVAAQLVQLQLLQQLVALVSLWLIATTLMGWSAGRLLLFPAALLLLGIPLWDFLVDPLRMLTVWFSQHMLDLLAVPAHIDGYRISVPSGVLVVAGGCSGLNLFLAMLLLGLLFAESHQLPRARRVAIVLLAAAVGILDNWVRVFLLVIIAHQTEMQSELVHHHGNFGWWIFAIALLPYFWLAGRIERGGDHRQAPTHGLHEPISSAGKASSIGILICVLLIGAWWGAQQLEHRRGSASAGLQAPVGAVPVPASWLPAYTGQDVTQAWRKSANGDTYDIVALTYLEQRADKKLIYYSNVIAEEEVLRPLGRLAVAPGFDVNVAMVGGDSPRLVWWYWWVDGSTSVSALKTKLLQLKATLLGDPSAALIAVSKPCGISGCTQQGLSPDDDLRQILLELRQLQAAR